MMPGPDRPPADQFSALSFEWDEFVTIATVFAQRLRAGSLPPDDAYAWTRVLCADARHWMKAEPDESTEC
jgi:hypothetical protein